MTGQILTCCDIRIAGIEKKLPLPIGEGIGDAVCTAENDVASFDKELFRWRAFVDPDIDASEVEVSASGPSELPKFFPSRNTHMA
jgi:hypothetical protein